MSDPHRTIRHGERTIYDSEWIRLTLVDIEPPGGHRFEHHVVYMKPVAIAVLVNRSNSVLMLKRHRWATDEVGYELLGGLVEEGESPAKTAAREAEEESGFRPLGEPTALASFQPLPGMVDAPIDLFLWREFRKVGDPSDPEEAGDLEWIPLSDIPRLLSERQVLGAGTIIALLQLLAIDKGINFTPASS